MTPQEISALISDCLKTSGISHFGFTQLQKPITFEFYQKWLQQNFHGEMKYLVEHAPIKERPESRWPSMRSALVLAMPYFPHPEPNNHSPLKVTRMSLYSRGLDYHHWFKQRMAKITEELTRHFPDDEFLCLTDSTPILERDLAFRAGLGWFGKNTCLIHPKKGSLFFIGEILTSLKVESEIEPLPDFCGKCNRCVEACPTGAILEEKTLDAQKCISYLTIESRQLPPLELRSKMGDWLFGCDICQTVCPWNQKIFKGQLSTENTLSLEKKDEVLLEEELRFILASSGKSLEKSFRGTPLDRAGSFGLKRNALVIVGNRKIKTLATEVESLLTHERLGELASWALAQLH